MILVIPLAGLGTRYKNKGFDLPKPLIEIDGKTILAHSFESVKKIKYSRLIFIALREHEELYSIKKNIKKNIASEFELILIDKPTQGQMCTVLEASKYFNSEESLLIASSDTIVENNLDIQLENFIYDGLISVIEADGDEWSFAKTDDRGNVIEVAEKRRISNYASTGIYFFKRSTDFYHYALEIINKKIKTKGEYYIMPMYNLMIRDNLKIKIALAKNFWDLGTPEKKLIFEKR